MVEVLALEVRGKASGVVEVLVLGAEGEGVLLLVMAQRRRAATDGQRTHLVRLLPLGIRCPVLVELRLQR